tara:strand:- start:73 stop:480 length:408 start_codon:yes stop_codon:yes gene_type:complete
MIKINENKIIRTYRKDLTIEEVCNVNSKFETCDVCKKRLEPNDMCMYYLEDYKEQKILDTGCLVYCSATCLNYGTLKQDIRKLIEAIRDNTEDDVDEHNNWSPYVPLQFIQEEIEIIIGEADLEFSLNHNLKQGE